MEKHYTADEGGEEQFPGGDRQPDDASGRGFGGGETPGYESGTGEMADANLDRPAGEDAHNRETEPERPQIYIVDVAAAEAGMVRGRWLDAAQDAHRLEIAVHDLVNESPFRATTAYTIQQARGFQGYEISEHADLATVSRVACGIAAYGRAFVAYLEWRGTGREVVDQFGRSYQGSWSNIEAWAATVADELGWWQQLEATVEPALLAYLGIDFERLGRDLAAEAYVVEDEERQEIHVFRLAR